MELIPEVRGTLKFLSRFQVELLHDLFNQSVLLQNIGLSLHRKSHLSQYSRRRWDRYRGYSRNSRWFLDLECSLERYQRG